jgi:hypothetical protein
MRPFCVEGDADVEDSANAANGPGGRFFHRSVRYSEDMGLDVDGIDPPPGARPAQRLTVRTGRCNCR